MKDTMDLLQKIRGIAVRRAVYRPEAYLFVMEAVDRAMADSDEGKHVSGEDLLDRIKTLGQDRYGVMAGEVFKAWGVRSTLDFGRIVFHLVDEGLCQKREGDTLGEFIDRFDFAEAFTLKAREGRG